MSRGGSLSTFKQVLRDYLVPRRVRGRPLLLAGYYLLCALLAVALIYEVNRRSTMWPLVVFFGIVITRLVIMFREERQAIGAGPPDAGAGQPSGSNVAD